ncbi:hypothetical protein HPB52_022374 [Rhipicephalus sanguineus]|uniref:Helitron helicase-like domain-containing protein n=1 Tax=Rhipicephalus sanguineus TaxID=34632 RepID=A0A9D4T4T3_RHISA|nr:hypothetical protein HPB52_022374 [Rhipicephalus sanguineus]
MSELHKERLLQLIEKLKEPDKACSCKVKDMHSLYKAGLVNNNPVVCSLFFDKLVRIITMALQNTKISPFGPHHVVGYFKRTEFQQRGSVLAHVLIWLTEAPQEDLMDYVK